MKRCTLATALVGLFLMAGLQNATAEPTGRLITQNDAQRHGLRRAWFSQVRLKSGRSRLSHLRLAEGTGKLPDTLFAQTDQGVIQAIDAETGQTLWVRGVGARNHPTMAISASNELVGVLNGTRLYLLDRSDGRVLWERKINGVPVDGPVLTDKFACVPTLSGRILAYEIKKRKFDKEEEDSDAEKIARAMKDKDSEKSDSGPSETTLASLTKPVKNGGPLALDYESVYPLTCVSFGQVACQPIFLLEDNKNQYLAWSTNKGLFVGYVDLQRQNEFAVSFQLRTHSEIVTQPTYLPPAVGNGNAEGLIFAASKLGHVYAVSAMRGTEKWNYAIGQPIAEPVIPIKDRVYVITRLGNLFCLDAMTGLECWSTGGVGQFLASSGKKIYVADRFGQIRVLDAQSGSTVDGLFAASLPIKLRNQWTDRIYLASPSGLVQCLHETSLSKPIYYRKTGQGPVEGGEEFVPDQQGQNEEKPDETGKSEGGSPFDEPDGGGGSPFDEPDGGGASPFD